MANTDKKLGEQSIPKLILIMCLPAVVAQLINVLYGLVDRAFIGHIQDVGDVALTGVGVALPIVTLVSAFSAFVGMGAAPLASIALGKGDKEESERLLGNGITLLVIFSVILTAFFMIFAEPILYAFGASDATIVYAKSYLDIYLLGTLFIQIAIGLNTFISIQGHSFTAMFSVLIGAVLNIILDYLFIFIFNMGVKGAALATIISQFVSSIWVMAFLLSKKSIFKIRLKNMLLNKRVILGILSLGISPFVMQSTESIVGVVLNTGLKKYGGDMYVGSMTIMLSVMQLIVLPINGLTQGTQPIISYNYGAGKKDRVVKTFKWTLAIACTATTLYCLSAVFFPRAFAEMFSDKPELITLTEKLLPIYVAGIFAYGAQLACQGTFLALGQAKISVFLALLRKIILLVPLALILPNFFGVNGIISAEPIADITASTTTLTIFLLNYKKILGIKKS